MSVTISNETDKVSVGAAIASEVRTCLVEEMRKAIALKNWERLATLIDSYARMVS